MGDKLKTFYIIEMDRDYRAWSDTLKKQFYSLEEAEEWCRKESWTGYDYYVEREIPNAPS